MSAPECAKSSITSGGLIRFFFFLFVFLLNLIFLLYSSMGWVDSHQMLVTYQSINSHITGSAAKI